MLHLVPIKLVALSKWLLGPLGVLVLGLIGAIQEGGMISLILAHPVVSAVAFMFVFSAAVTAMRNPSDGWYPWFYRFTHVLAASAESELKDRFHLPAPEDSTPQTTEVNVKTTT